MKGRFCVVDVGADRDSRINKDPACAAGSAEYPTRGWSRPATANDEVFVLPNAKQTNATVRTPTEGML